jgi:hypothetical protein
MQPPSSGGRIISDETLHSPIIILPHHTKRALRPPRPPGPPPLAPSPCGPPFRPP